MRGRGTENERGGRVGEYTCIYTYVYAHTNLELSVQCSLASLSIRL